MRKSTVTLFFAAVCLILISIPLYAQSLPLRVGVYENKPLVFKDDEGHFSGIYIDILEYIAKKADWQLSYVEGSWQEGLERLSAGEIDILTAIAFSEDRNRIFDFTGNTLISNWAQVYVTEDSEIQSILNLRNKKVAVVRDDIYYQKIAELLNKFGISCNFIEVAEYADVFKSVHEGIADAGVLSRLFGQQYESEFELIKSNIVCCPTELRIAFPKSRMKNIINTIDDQLATLKKDRKSVYYSSLYTWIESPPQREFPPWLMNAMMITGVLIIMLTGGGIVLRQQVRARTRDLRASEEKFRAIFDNTTDGILVVDSADRRFYTGNSAVCTMLGYTLEEILQLRVEDLHLSKDFPRVIEQFERQARKEIKLARDIPVVRKDGSVFYADINASPLIYSGKDCLIGTFRDVTERKQLEEQLLQAQKMEAVGQLAGGVAHDFNNILSAIINYCYLVKRRLDPDDPSVVEIDRVMSLADSASQITRGLLTFSRKQHYELVPVNLNHIIRDFESLMRKFIGEDIDAEVNLADSEPVIIADKAQIEQVLINLVTNARDAMSGGGSLDISTGIELIDESTARNIGVEKAGNFAVLKVSDTGTGMDSNTVPRIFEPFFTTKETGKGTGLGMSIVYGIINQHKGGITVLSEPGKGTTFNIYLPEASRSAEQMKVETELPLRGHGETILFAEDETMVRESILNILEEYNYRVITASNGIEAIEKFRENQNAIGLVIFDIVMPKMNGKEALEHIRKITPDISAIFISGYSADDIHRKKALHGDAVYLSKPVMPDELLTKIREVLEGQSGR